MDTVTIPTTTLDASYEGATGAVLGERIIQEYLKVGFQRIHTDPDARTTIITELFRRLNATERTDIDRWFAANPVEVVLDFPAGGYKMPVIGVIGGSEFEDESIDTLGGFLMQDGYAPPTEAYGHALRSSWKLLLAVQKDSNAIYWLMYVAKAILQANKDELAAWGLHAITFPSATEVRMRDDLPPDRAYFRDLVVQAYTHFAIRKTYPVVTALTVGIRVVQDAVTVELNPEET